jgi:hypothetical protein
MGKAIVFRGAGVALLAQLTLSAVLWMILAALLGRVPEDRKVSDIDVASVVLLIGGIVALVLIGFLRQSGADYPLSSNPVMQRLMLLGLLIAAAPAFMAAIYCAGATRWRQRKISRAARGTEESDSHVTNDGTAMISRGFVYTLAGIISWSLFVAACLGWFISALSLRPGTNPLSELAMGFGFPVILLIAPCLSLAALIWWLIKCLWLTPASARSEAKYAVRWYHRTLGAFVVLASVAHLALCIAMVPIWRAADDGVNDLIRNGEVAAMMKTVQAQPVMKK